MSVRLVIVEKVTRSAGIAGLVNYRVEARTMDGRPRRFTFSGNIFAGPVYVHRHDEAGQHDDVIHEPRRFGEFATASWVHRFLGAGQEAG